jgi:hypothetical protein
MMMMMLMMMMILELASTSCCCMWSASFLTWRNLRNCVARQFFRAPNTYTTTKYPSTYLEAVTQ